ncbi:MAG: DEAD/DEAH box helicase family protein [Deltaproteobacteria bacterium]|nr:DEAD/DEAH box helicase family protein [Deltaproteobacteria bacterium]
MKLNEMKKMKLKLEQLEYQKEAIESVISVFKGQQKNNFDNACINGIRANIVSLTNKDIKKNIKDIVKKNGLSEHTAKISEDNDICVEMETGTGKTLVYIKTIFELFKNYGFTKFIILVPSVAIKEGVLKTFEIFKKQLEDIYNVKPNFFEYQSKRLSKVASFMEEQHPQVMVITLQSFNTEDRILAQEKREDLFFNISYINAIAKTNPIIVMDEPQEGMDTENSVKRIKKLNPLVKIRYSATHKTVKNLIYRLTPFESYKQGIVKKIEVLTVSEKNDEASMKIELFKMEFGKHEPKVMLKAWHMLKTGFKFKNTKKLQKNDNLQDITKNIIYKNYIIERIAKPIREKGYVKFTNGAIIYENMQAKDYNAIFNEQLYWLIDSHFRKKEKLKPKGIKPLSLIFIDKVDNYINPDGIIKKAFEEQYKKVFFNFYKKKPQKEEIEKIQGYYFAKTGKGDYTDNNRSMATNKELYNLILKDKEKLLSFENPVQFIFSHSALGVGWDNPNVFNIATLNYSYSEIKKRQEIGRGLRISVNQNGERVYDAPDTKEENEINLLTVIPNETYETFATQYQSEIIEIYGTKEAGAETRHKHKGENISKKRINRNEKLFNGNSFKNFWKKLSKKTDYLVSFDEENLINNSADALNKIVIPDHVAEISLNRITGISETAILSEHLGSQQKKIKTGFLSLDIAEEISEKTSLAYPTVFKIMQKVKNREQIVKNPPYFIYEASKKIKIIELEEMTRGLEYSLNGEKFDLNMFAPYIETSVDTIEPSKNRGVYDHIIYDSEIEKNFANKADNDPEIVCFLKLPKFYVIQTPAGAYNPDFGIVVKKKKIRENKGEEYYFVIETKATNDLNDKKSLTETEIYKIQCALKHFEALGIESKIKYIAPVKEYETFKNRI